MSSSMAEPSGVRKASGLYMMVSFLTMTCAARPVTTVSFSMVDSDSKSRLPKS